MVAKGEAFGAWEVMGSQKLCREFTRMSANEIPGVESMRLSLSLFLPVGSRRQGTQNKSLLCKLVLLSATYFRGGVQMSHVSSCQ
jgi:hypothetical protein